MVPRWAQFTDDRPDLQFLFVHVELRKVTTLNRGWHHQLTGSRLMSSFGSWRLSSGRRFRQDPEPQSARHLGARCPAHEFSLARIPIHLPITWSKRASEAPGMTHLPLSWVLSLTPPPDDVASCRRRKNKESDLLQISSDRKINLCEFMNRTQFPGVPGCCPLERRCLT